MPSWNVKLGTRKQVVRIDKIINKKPDFVIVGLSNGKQQKLCDANFPGWRKAGPNRRIELTIRESVVGARLLVESFHEKVNNFIAETLDNTNGLFFMWTCEQCQSMGCVTYEDGDDSQVIRRKIEATHKTEIKPNCDKSTFKVYDHRGMQQRESALAVALAK